MNETKKSTYGGARQGAGRKSRPSKVMRVPMPLVTRVETLINKYRKQHGLDR